MFDRHGLLDGLARDLRGSGISSAVGDSDRRLVAFSINFNLAHNRRMSRSNSAMSRDALGLRLLCCVSDLMTGYFTLRDLSWRGEKKRLQTGSATIRTTCSCTGSSSLRENSTRGSQSTRSWHFQPSNRLAVGGTRLSHTSSRTVNRNGTTMLNGLSDSSGEGYRVGLDKSPAGFRLYCPDH